MIALMATNAAIATTTNTITTTAADGDGIECGFAFFYILIFLVHMGGLLKCETDLHTDIM